MTGKKRKDGGKIQSTLFVKSAREESINSEIEQHLNEALRLLKQSQTKAKSIRLQPAENNNDDSLYEILKRKQDLADTSKTADFEEFNNFENINPDNLVRDFQQCKEQNRELERENDRLNQELLFATTTIENLESLNNQLKETVKVTVARNKLLKMHNKQLQSVVKSEPKASYKDIKLNEMDSSDDDDAQEGVLLSEVTQLSQPDAASTQKSDKKIMIKMESQDNIADQLDSPFLTQSSQQRFSPLESEKFVKRRKSGSSMSTNGSPLKRRLLDFSQTRTIHRIGALNSDQIDDSQENISLEPLIKFGDGILDKKTNPMIKLENDRPVDRLNNHPLIIISLNNTVNGKINLSVNPITNKLWYPEDFQLVKEYDRIDGRFGQTLEQIPVKTRLYYKRQLKYISELVNEKFEDSTHESLNHNSQYEIDLTQQTQPNNEPRLITPPQDPEYNLSNSEIEQEFKYEINNTNFNEYNRYYEDIGRTKKVKRWVIDDRPPEWFASEFPNTQEQLKRNEQRNIRADKRALFRLFHACFMVKNGEQIGMWKFIDPHWNNAIKSGEFVIDLNLFSSK